MLKSFLISLRKLFPSRYDTILRFIALATFVNVALIAEGQFSFHNTQQEQQTTNQKETSWYDPNVILASFTVFFSGLLALFTWRLVDSTNKLWRVSERSLTELERPQIDVEVTDIGMSFNEVGNVTSTRDIKYQFINHGRTIASIVELVERWPIVKRTPLANGEYKRNLPEPIDSNIVSGREFPIGVVIGMRKPYTLMQNPYAVIDIPNLDISPTLFRYEGNFSDLYFYGIPQIFGHFR